MLPALAFLFEYPLPVAIGTTITAVILTATSGAIGHIRIKNVDYSTVKIVALSGAIGAGVGSILFFYISKSGMATEPYSGICVPIREREDDIRGS